MKNTKNTKKKLSLILLLAISINLIPVQFDVNLINITELNVIKIVINCKEK